MKTSKAITLTDETKRIIKTACQIATINTGMKYGADYLDEALLIWCKDGDKRRKTLAGVSLVHHTEDEILFELLSGLMIEVGGWPKC